MSLSPRKSVIIYHNLPLQFISLYVKEFKDLNATSNSPLVRATLSSKDKGLKGVIESSVEISLKDAEPEIKQQAVDALYQASKKIIKARLDNPELNNVQAFEQIAGELSIAYPSDTKIARTLEERLSLLRKENNDEIVFGKERVDNPERKMSSFLGGK